MLKIVDVVDGVFNQLKEHGLAEHTLQQSMWSVYRAIIKYHSANGTDEYSPKLVTELCEIQRQRYENGEISRKFYRSFVTAEFRIRTYVEFGSVNFSIVKDCCRFKPSETYMKLSETILNSNGLTESIKPKLSSTFRKFFCFCEGKGHSIEQITDKDFLDFISEASKSAPKNMTFVMRVLRIIAEHIRSNNIADLKINLSIFRPQTSSRQMIPGYSQEEIFKILSVINEETSETPKRDRAMILLSFNAGFRGIDIRTALLSDMDWKTGEIRIVQHKTGEPLSASLNGMTLNAIADYILNERPKSKYQNIFLKYGPPFSPLKTTAPLDYAIDKYCRLSGVPKKKNRAFHGLRRGYAIELAEAEVSLTTISQMLGHRDFSSDKAYLTFNRTQTSLCSLDFSDVPISNGFYAGMFSSMPSEILKGGEAE